MTPTTSATTTTDASPPFALAAHPPYLPLPGEPAPELKRLASDVVQAVATYGEDGGTIEAARARAAAAGAPASIADTSGALLRPGGPASAEIVYPQLGGLTRTEASVMVVVRQHFADDVVSRTVDVRLAAGPSAWRVTAFASIGPVAAPVTDPAGAAAAVLAHPNLRLPDSARNDVANGTVDDRLVRLLLRLADQHRLDVASFIAGHPREVFGTDRLSNHTAGRAVDIWAVDGVPISQLHESTAIQELLRRLLAEGVPEIGSPWDLDGPGSSDSFTNTVHQDHLHLAFDAVRP